VGRHVGGKDWLQNWVLRVGVPVETKPCETLSTRENFVTTHSMIPTREKRGEDGNNGKNGKEEETVEYTSALPVRVHESQYNEKNI